ncbi:rhodanese-related sulfurtransferase [Mucilaginibacter gracilis]|uniref:Rhodanese-related sulfurtransferase n=1 Tax=Mucilaginibacter gracilis TaxID=423350 RepID=A0A495J3Y5_9SPHI|nr:rhodanese-like domain-containing protein [Mucilaginibacter gracilis]RKR83696.1 rhodanese-related sulfurtransferase [Mucilaginibacter gracilis]
MNIFKQLFGASDEPDLQTIIKEGAFLVDVRNPSEFAGGHVKGSVNIPLDQIVTQLSKFKNKKNIVVFCQSGGRSMMAKSILTKSGIDNVINGKTWEQVNRFVNQ